MSTKVRKKVVHKRKLNLDDSVKHLEGKLERFCKAVEAKQNEIISKHNHLTSAIDELQKAQQQIATFAAQEFGKLLGHQQMVTQQFADSIDHLDLNVLASARVLKEVFGQISQIDAFLQKISSDSSQLELSEEETEKIKTETTEWFNDVVAAAFQHVQDERKAEEQRRAEEAQREEEAKKAAEEAALEMQEGARAEAELHKVAQEERSVVAPMSGGPGADIPEGADVFGG